MLTVPNGSRYLTVCTPHAFLVFQSIGHRHCQVSRLWQRFTDRALSALSVIIGTALCLDDEIPPIPPDLGPEPVMQLEGTHLDFQADGAILPAGTSDGRFAAGDGQDMKTIAGSGGPAVDCDDEILTTANVIPPIYRTPCPTFRWTLALALRFLRRLERLWAPVPVASGGAQMIPECGGV